MARVTVEDCIEIVPDRFDLVLLSARRAKQIATGAPLTVERDNDKDSVVSLREIAGEEVSSDDLTEDLIYSLSKRRFQEPRMEAAAIEDASDESTEDAEVKEVFEADIESDALGAASDEEGEVLADAETPAAAPAPAGAMSFGDDDVDVED